MSKESYNFRLRRCRRYLDRYGYRLHKIRGEDSYTIDNAETGEEVYGLDDKYDLSCVEDFVKELLNG